LTTYVALLRGINLGSVNKVPMKELTTVFQDMGHEGVRTHLQSGNVIFDARSSSSKKLAAEIENAVFKAFGVRSPVILRAARDLQRTVEGNPFPVQGAKPTSLQVMFLADRPSSTAVKTLDPDRSPPDQFHVKGREIYLWLPNGGGRSKLTNDYFEKRLGTSATARNWNTITKLLDLST
jgi:uncharacterized protein (DUF1697 family)